MLVTDAAGRSEGAGEFTTEALKAPVIEGESASSVGSTSATLKAQVNPSYQSTSYSFEYSSKESTGVLQAPITTIKGSRSLTANAGTQTASVPAGAVLSPGTTYYYRVVAQNATPPAADGPVSSFTTPPQPTTEAPTAVTATMASFHGRLDPLNEDLATRYYFEYNTGAECSGGQRTAEEEAGTGQGAAAESAQASELQPDAPYAVCFVAVNEFGSQQGQSEHFTTSVAPPTVLSESESTPVVTPFEAMLEVQIDPNGQATTYAFEYSTETTGEVLEGTITTIKGSKALPAELSPQPASVITGHLLPATTYYYRVVAENATTPASAGAVASFTTPAAEAPAIESEGTANITQTTATLEAQINPNYQQTTVSFEYAEHESEVLRQDGTKGTMISGKTIPAGSIQAGSSEHSTSAELAGLAPNKTYYYRVVAVNATDTATQMLTVAHFTTSTVPMASTGAASGVSATGATVSGAINPDGLPAAYYVQYGGTTNYGQQSLSGQAGEGVSPTLVVITLSGLEPGRTYHYRLVATNTNEEGTPQTGYGEDETFTTPSIPPILSEVFVSGVSESGATISATVNPQSLATRWELQVGATLEALQPVLSGDTSTTTPLSLSVGSLTPGTTYYYKLIVTNLNGTLEPEGSFTTAAAPAAAAPGSLPTLIPYQTIAELNAKEAREGKGLPNPSITKSLTKAQKLGKALKACRKKPKRQRAACERKARKKYPTARR